MIALTTDCVKAQSAFENRPEAPRSLPKACRPHRRMSDGMGGERAKVLPPIPIQSTASRCRFAIGLTEWNVLPASLRNLERTGKGIRRIARLSGVVLIEPDRGIVRAFEGQVGDGSFSEQGGGHGVAQWVRGPRLVERDLQRWAGWGIDQPNVWIKVKMDGGLGLAPAALCSLEEDLAVENHGQAGFIVGAEIAGLRKDVVVEAHVAAGVVVKACDFGGMGFEDGSLASIVGDHGCASAKEVMRKGSSTGDDQLRHR